MILNYFEENVVCKTNHSQRFSYHISIENIFHLLSLLKAILLIMAEKRNMRVTCGIYIF